MSKNSKSFGPGFQTSTSRLFRGEYGLISLAIAAYLVWSYRSGIGWITLIVLIFFAILPDLASFIPIGLYSTREVERGSWPSWGPALYNTFHTILLWALVFGIVWILLQAPYLPLLSWLIHITLDRSLGFTLRARK
jgi:hypothetical protein